MPTLGRQGRDRHPEGTQAGKQFRLRGKGIKGVRSSVPGDLYCHIAVETPVKLTEHQRKLLKELDESLKKGGAKHSPSEESWADKLKGFFSTARQRRRSRHPGTSTARAAPQPGPKPNPGDNGGMALRLFRTTGYSTLLMPGEARIATHPATLVLWGSLWLAVACNVAVWRWLGGSLDWRTALASILVIAGQQRHLSASWAGGARSSPPSPSPWSPGALVAAGMWSQQLPMDTLWQGPPRTLLPAWTSFMRWHVLALVAALAVVPIVWLWNHAVRRLPGPRQLQSNIKGCLLAVLAFGAGLFLLR